MIDIFLQQERLPPRNQGGDARALLAALSKYVDLEYANDFLARVMLDASFYSVWLFLVGLMFIFRTTTASSRFNRGSELMYEMLGAFTESASFIISLSRASKRSRVEIEQF